MINDVLAIWHRVVQVLKPAVITRLGLRYINRIEKETGNDHLGDWLVKNDFIANSLLYSEAGFFLRAQFRLASENVLIITVGDTEPEADYGYGAIIFDIDRIAEKDIILDQEVLKAELNRLHTDVWNVFSSAKGEKLERLLQRRL